MKTAKKTAVQTANRRTAKARQTGADIQTDALLERMFPKEMKAVRGRLSLRVEISKNGCLLARTDIPYDAAGLAHLVRCRPSYAKARVGRERVVTLG